MSAYDDNGDGWVDGWVDGVPRRPIQIEQDWEGAAAGSQWYASEEEVAEIRAAGVTVFHVNDERDE